MLRRIVFVSIQRAKNTIQLKTDHFVKLFAVLFFVNNFENFKQQRYAKAEEEKEKNLAPACVRVFPFAT